LAGQAGTISRAIRWSKFVRRSIGCIRPYRARRDDSSWRHTVRRFGSGRLDQMVGFSIFRVPESRFFVLR